MKKGTEKGKGKGGHPHSPFSTIPYISRPWGGGRGPFEKKKKKRREVEWIRCLNPVLHSSRTRIRAIERGERNHEGKGGEDRHRQAPAPTSEIRGGRKWKRRSEAPGLARRVPYAHTGRDVRREGKVPRSACLLVLEPPKLRREGKEKKKPPGKKGEERETTPRSRACRLDQHSSITPSWKMGGGRGGTMGGKKKKDCGLRVPPRHLSQHKQKKKRREKRRRETARISCGLFFTMGDRRLAEGVQERGGGKDRRPPSFTPLSSPPMAKKFRRGGERGVSPLLYFSAASRGGKEGKKTWRRKVGREFQAEEKGGGTKKKKRKKKAGAARRGPLGFQGGRPKKKERGMT